MGVGVCGCVWVCVWVCVWGAGMRPFAILPHLHDLFTHRQAANVLVDEAGVVYICDWGMARVKRSATSTTQSQSASTVSGGKPTGTVPWNSPELQPDPSSGVPLSPSPTRKSDVWAFATTAWEVLTGRLPYADMPMARVSDHVIGMCIFNGKTPAEYAEWPAEVPRGVVELLGECWARMPVDRPTMARVASCLRAFSTGRASGGDSNLQAQDVRRMADAFQSADGTCSYSHTTVRSAEADTPVGLSSGGSRGEAMRSSGYHCDAASAAGMSASAQSTSLPHECVGFVHPPTTLAAPHLSDAVSPAPASPLGAFTMVPGGQAYAILVVDIDPRFVWETRYIHNAMTALVPFHGRHVVGTANQCWTRGGPPLPYNQFFTMRSVRGSSTITLSPRCCDGALYMGMRPGQSSLCLVDSPFEWQVEAVPHMLGRVRIGLAGRFIQADTTANGRELHLAMAGFVDDRQLLRITYVTATGEIESPLASPGLTPGPSRPVLADGTYAVISLKYSLAWDMPHSGDEHKRPGGADPRVLLWTPHIRPNPNQCFAIKSIAGDARGAVSISPLCCLGQMFLGMRGDSVFLVPHPFAWCLSHVDGIPDHFWVKNDRGQHIEAPWTLFSGRASALTLGEPTRSRRQVFEFKAISN